MCVISRDVSHDLVNLRPCASDPSVTLILNSSFHHNTQCTRTHGTFNTFRKRDRGTELFTQTVKGNSWILTISLLFWNLPCGIIMITQHLTFAWLMILKTISSLFDSDLNVRVRLSPDKGGTRDSWWSQVSFKPKSNSKPSTVLTPRQTRWQQD